MDLGIRPARLDDVPAIAAFTKDTFEWGDYVADSLPRWLDAPNGVVLVAVDEADRPVAMTRSVLLSPTEAWFQAIRVDPQLRRLGIAGRLTEALLDWTRSAGARIARLLIEEWNEPSKGAVAKVGFRRVCDWVEAERPVGDASPLPAGNGGRRVPALEQLTRAHSSEAEPAFMAWTSSELYRASRGLFAIGWTWRRLTTEDLLAAARLEALWMARAGWAIAARRDQTFQVGWLETSPDDATMVVRSLVDLAVESGAERIQLMVPNVDWLTVALRRAGCELRPMAVYALPL